MTKVVTNLFCEDKKKNFWIGFFVVFILVGVTIYALWSDRNFYHNVYPKLNDYEKDKFDQAQQDDSSVYNNPRIGSSSAFNE